MAETIYKANVGNLCTRQLIADTIISCVDSQLKKHDIQKYQKFAKTDALAGYYFNNQSAEVLVSNNNGEVRVSISGDERQIKKTKSKLLKIVGGLELS